MMQTKVVSFNFSSTLFLLQIIKNECIKTPQALRQKHKRTQNAI
jgi:hypothetical protein